MAIFSRRILQRLLTENSHFLLEGQTKKHVERLNHLSEEQTLAYEWEVVLLNALSKSGTVVHEKSFGGSSKADIYFESFDNPRARFLGDITVVSDKGLDESNPVQVLRERLNDIVKEHGLKANCFEVKVGSTPGPIYKECPKVRLKLPGRARLKQIIFNEHFDTFLSAILQDPNAKHEHDIKTREIDLLITYNPGQLYASTQYVSYTVLTSLTENTVYQALERKASQLAETNYNGTLGIFLCDGGSSFFAQENTRGLSYSTREIIQGFLSNHGNIDFIVTFTIRRKAALTISPQMNPYFILTSLYYKQYDELPFDIEGLCESIRKELPLPEDSPRNAIYLIKSPRANLGRSHWGGLEMSAGKSTTKVKISSRALLELLAGKVDQKKFFEHHGFIPFARTRSEIINPFDGALNRGQLIKDISIEKSDQYDDDWITFNLEGPDPAISPLMINSITKGSKTKK